MRPNAEIGASAREMEGGKRDDCFKDCWRASENRSAALTLKRDLLGEALLKSRMTAGRQIQERSQRGFLERRVMTQKSSGGTSRSQ